MDLSTYKTGGFPKGYPSNIQTLYSPVDNVHGAILDVIGSAKHSLVVGMYGYDDPDIQAVILEKMKDENIYVQLTLDSSQAGGVHEKELLAQASYPATSIAIGRSEKGAIIHIKIIVVDSVAVITGSTNLSAAGEDKQDNDCIIIYDPFVAGEASARISMIHANILNKIKEK